MSDTIMSRLPQWAVDQAHTKIAEGCCASHYRAVLDHDRTCVSLHNVWLPTCMTPSGCDIESCDACDLICADSGGLMFVELPCGRDTFLCECCTR